MNDESEAILNEILDSVEPNDDGDYVEFASQAPPLPSPEPEEVKKNQAIENHTQWALGGNNKYTPVGSTAARLPAGVYETWATPGAWGVEKLEIPSDGIYLLPDMATRLVLDEVEKFWGSESKYRKHKLLYKRGILLFGPPGGGKTVCVKLLINELIKRDGIVLLVSHVNLAIAALKAIRRIENRRNLIVVFEDIDEIINYNGEAAVLSMLDGENNIDNILHIATTNYASRLGPRIINRPSRFDRRVSVGMPSAEARRAYLKAATNCGLEEGDLIKWVNDTDQMSIAHLRELVASVYCLDQPYQETVERLQDMAKHVKEDDGMAHRTSGFKTAARKFGAVASPPGTTAGY